jgi:pimeloyl-ACP methyl ester carboxylesterase
MRRWAKRFVISVAALVVAAAVAGATYQWSATRRDLAAAPYPGQLIDVGGHRLHVWCAGSGAPAVILESGLAGTTADWGFVQPEVARFTRVCSYDRAGMGYSDPGPSPRTARQIARELAALIQRSGIHDPVVLAAASSGGLPVRVFASEHGTLAAGLVLIDASHEDQGHDVPALAPFVGVLSTLGALRAAGVGFGLSPSSLAPSVRGFATATRFRAAGQQAAADEIMRMNDTAAEVRASRRQLTIPIVVLTGARGADDAWRRLQRDQVALSPRGCQIVAEESGHVIPVEAPGLVVSAIRAVVDAVRRRTNGPVCAEVVV